MATMATLFSGAGGLDLGFEQAGFNCIMANELDTDAAAAWRENRPARAEVMRVGDLNDYLPSLGVLRGSVDVVIGGPPCQGFSVAGKMDPSDERSRLVFSFLDAVKRIQPDVFIMENVAALGNLKRWEGVRRQYVEKARIYGYNVEFRILSTSDYGVPQKRRRVIFCGVRSGHGDPAALFAALESYRQPAPTAREVILSAGVYGSESNPSTCRAKVTLAKAPVMRKSPYAGMVVNGAGRPVDLDGLPPTLPATMGGNKTPIVDEHALHDASCRNWFDWYHAELRVKGADRALEVDVPDHLRRLTIKEAAAIQTFPANYHFSGKRCAQYRQIGNAVPPRFAYAIARALMDAFPALLS